MSITPPKKLSTSLSTHELENELSILFSGKLLLRKEIPLLEKQFQELVCSGCFTPFPSIKKKIFEPQCQRCGNQKLSLFATIPCHSCKKSHIYCRKCIEMGRVIECEPLYYWTGPKANWPIHKNPCSWSGQLTDDQQRAADRIFKAIVNKERELLIWAVCGAGKTEMLFPGITETLQLGKRICLATPRADVVRELLPRLKQAFSSVSIQALYGGSEEKDATAQFIIATTHQLLRFQEAFDVMIIDEIDAFPYHADPSLPFAANRAIKSTGTNIYLTATPRQKHRMQIVSKKLPHIFVPARFHGHPLPVPVFRICYSLKKDLKKHLPPMTFLKWLKKRKHPDRQLLLFVPTITLAEKMRLELTLLLLNEGLIETASDLVSVHASDQDRKEKVNQFRQKNMSILITTTILERGVTFPSVDVAVVDAGNKVFDEAALVQIAGRAGRSPDDPTGEVIFFHDGKTEAMVQAVKSITAMNKRGGFR